MCWTEDWAFLGMAIGAKSTVLNLWVHCVSAEFFPGVPVCLRVPGAYCFGALWHFLSFPYSKKVRTAV